MTRKVLITLSAVAALATSAPATDFNDLDPVLKYRIGLTTHEVDIDVLDVGDWHDLSYLGKTFRVAPATVRFKPINFGRTSPMNLLDDGDKIYIVNDRTLDDLEAGLPVGHKNYEMSWPEFKP